MAARKCHYLHSYIKVSLSSHCHVNWVYRLLEVLLINFLNHHGCILCHIAYWFFLRKIHVCGKQPSSFCFVHWLYSGWKRLNFEVPTYELYWLLHHSIFIHLCLRHGTRFSPRISRNWHLITSKDNLPFLQNVQTSSSNLMIFPDQFLFCWHTEGKTWRALSKSNT